jgi:hypothetical protein
LPVTAHSRLPDNASESQRLTIIYGSAYHSETPGECAKNGRHRGAAFAACVFTCQCPTAPPPTARPSCEAAIAKYGQAEHCNPKPKTGIACPYSIAFPIPHRGIGRHARTRARTHAACTHTHAPHTRARLEHAQPVVAGSTLVRVHDMSTTPVGTHA